MFRSPLLKEHFKVYMSAPGFKSRSDLTEKALKAKFEKFYYNMSNYYSF